MESSKQYCFSFLGLYFIWMVAMRSIWSASGIVCEVHHFQPSIANTSLPAKNREVNLCWLKDAFQSPAHTAWHLSIILNICTKTTSGFVSLAKRNICSNLSPVSRFLIPVVKGWSQIWNIRSGVCQYHLLYSITPGWQDTSIMHYGLLC